MHFSCSSNRFIALIFFWGGGVDMVCVDWGVVIFHGGRRSNFAGFSKLEKMLERIVEN